MKELFIMVWPLFTVGTIIAMAVLAAVLYYQRHLRYQGGWRASQRPITTLAARRWWDWLEDGAFVTMFAVAWLGILGKFCLWVTGEAGRVAAWWLTKPFIITIYRANIWLERRGYIARLRETNPLLFL